MADELSTPLGYGQACAKRRFRDEVGAMFALATHYSGSSRPKDEKRVYRCPTCRGWHLTSQEARHGR